MSMVKEEEAMYESIVWSGLIVIQVILHEDSGFGHLLG